MSEKENTASIDQLAIRVGSGVTPTGGSDVYADSGVIFIRSQNVTNSGLLLDDVAFIDDETHQWMSASAVYPFDVLLNITGASIGRCCFAPEGLGAANVNQHVCAIRLAKPNLRDAQFLSAALASDLGQSQIWRLNAGGNREGLNYRQLRSLRVPWPDKHLRVKIANILSALDETIQQTQALIAKYQQIREGLMQDLFTRGVTADGRLRPTRAQAPHLYTESPFGWIPKEWEEMSLGECFTLQRGFDITQEQQSRGHVPVVSSSGITSFHSVAMCGGPGVVIGRKGNLGNAYYLKGRYWPHDTTLWVKDFHGNSIPFARYFLIWMRLDRFDAATSVPTLNRNFIHPLRVAMPSPAEQDRIVLRLDTHEALVISAEDELAKHRMLKLGLMHDLLSGRMRVKVAKSEEVSA